MGPKCLLVSTGILEVLLKEETRYTGAFFFNKNVLIKKENSIGKINWQIFLISTRTCCGQYLAVAYPVCPLGSGTSVKQLLNIYTLT